MTASTGWLNEEPWLDSREGQEIFFSITAARQHLGPTEPPIQESAGALVPS